MSKNKAYHVVLFFDHRFFVYARGWIKALFGMK